ncbi:MAG: DMT family transporter [Burkholderiaceae bacterium]|nr:DMT family transporter [Burkholderiaceae bacterium]
MRQRDVIDLVLLAALWGASFLFIRVAAPQFGAFALMALRTGIGALVLLPFLLREKGGVAELRSHVGPIAWIGLLSSALPFVMFGYAIQHLNAGFTSILNATTPFWGAIVAYLWLGDRLGAMRVLGLAIGFGGVLVLVWGRVSFAEGGSGLPILATLVATLSYGLASIAAKKHLGGVGALAGAAGSQLSATLMLAPLAIVWWPAQPPDPRAWASAVLLGVLCSGLAYLLFFRLIARIGSTRTITVTFLIPVFAMLWGVLFLGESITARMLAGAATILAGTALTTGLVDPWHRLAALRRKAGPSAGPPPG